MRIHVLSEIFPPRPGGSGRWLWELYRRLHGHGFTVDVTAGACPGDAAFDAKSAFPIRRVPWQFRSWGLLNPPSALAYARASTRIARLSRASRVEAVHCGKCLQEGLIALMAGFVSRVPYACFAHGEEFTLAATSRELKWLTGVVLRRASFVVANSDHTKRLLVNDWRLAGDRVHVLPPGVDVDRFTPALPDPAIREKLGWTGRRVLLTVGALQKRKGQDMVIRALPAIRSRVPDVLYAIAGEGWERPALDQLVDELGVRDSVSFMGVPGDQDLVDLYRQCDLFVLANRRVGWDFEGFGIVLLEAQACARPVVAGRSGGTAEALLPGESGELVDCDTPAELADVCVTLLGDPGRRAVLGARGRAWVESRFAWDVLTAQAAAIFQSPAR